MCKSTGALVKIFLFFTLEKESAIKNPFKMWQGGTPDILTAPPAGLLKKKNSWGVSFSYLQLEADCAKTSFQVKDKNKISAHRDLKSNRATHSAAVHVLLREFFLFIQNFFFTSASLHILTSSSYIWLIAADFAPQQMFLLCRFSSPA